MEQCIVAVFDTRTAAQQAMGELVASGFPLRDVRLAEGRPVADGLPESGIKHFFSHIFGDEHSDESRLYDEALRQGNFVVSVMAAGDDQVDLATTVLGRFKPVDLEQQAGGANYAGRSTGGSPDLPQAWQGASMQGASKPGSPTQNASPQSSSMQGGSAQGGSARGGSAQGGTARGSQQFAPPPASSMPIQEQLHEAHRAAERARVRVYRPLQRGQAPEAGLSPALDKYFRSHWSRNYAAHGHTFDDYAAAYRFGSTMGGSEQYRGRQWGEVESTLRADWQSHHPGSAWEKFKAAIRHGWDGAIS